MYHRVKTDKKGNIRYEVSERYKDPLTGKTKTATVSYTSNTSRARNNAEKDLLDKIDKTINQFESLYDVKQIKTFGDLKEDWLENWSVTVKPATVEREMLVLSRLGEIVGDDFLLSKMTPLLIKNILEEYVSKYDPSHSTLQHIKCSLNKIFNHAVLYGIVKYSPVSSVRVSVSIERKKQARLNRENKFLEPHELSAFFDELRKRRNGNYYDLAIFLLFSGLRIGEATALTEEDIDFDENVIEVNKSLRYHGLRVDDFEYDTTKTTNSERKVLLPQVAMDALSRVIERGQRFDKHAELNPSENFKTSLSIFRTEYGATITSHTFRQLLYRVMDELKQHSNEMYGFEWTKTVVPHSFRHMHITYLQSGEDVALREIMGRVGHLNAETTMVYTHRTISSQQKSIEVLNKFAENSGISFEEVKTWSCKYSEIINAMIEKDIKQKTLKLPLNEFRENLGLKESYTPRHISGNILHKLHKDLSQYYENVNVETILNDKNKVWGYEVKWG